MLKNAPIFLDEAAANIAPENGKKLMDAIEALTREKTVVTRVRRRTGRHLPPLYRGAETD